MDDEAKINFSEKAFSKQQRQELKLRCLDLAMRNSTIDDSSGNIVNKAKAFYAFART